jgi:hypothetical protein
VTLINTMFMETGSIQKIFIGIIAIQR